MTREEILDRMREILTDTFEIDGASVELDTRLFDDLELDSIDAVDLVVKLQQLTGTKIDPETFKQVRTVRDVVDAVDALVNGKGQ